MLSERVRNSIVGITMLVAMGAFMFGSFLLGKFSAFHTVPPYTLTLLAPSSEGVNAGDHVDFNSVSIGSVHNVELAPDMQGVKITLDINRWVDIPVNALVYVGKPITVGNPFVTFKMPPAPAAGSPPAPVAMLPKDGTAPALHALVAPGLQGVLEQLGRVGGDLHELLEKRPLAEFDAEDPHTRVANISVMIQRIERVTRGVDVLVGDPQTQQKFRDIVENVHDTTADLKSIVKKINDTVTSADTVIDEIKNTARQVGAAATQASATLDTTRSEIVKTTQRVADLLASLQKATDALSSDTGTAGKFLNDPRLYESLLDLSKSLKSTTEDLKLLVQKWTDEGATLHLK